MNEILMTAAAGSAANGNGGMLAFVVQIVLLIVVAYFFIFRPQQKRAKQHREKIESVKRGDGVVTAGGLMGKVTKVAEDHLEVEIAQGVRVKVVKSTLADVVQPGGQPAND